MNNIQFNLSLEELKSHDDYLDFFRIKKENTKNVLDLFCGCGGMSLGFQREGFNILAGIDVDNDSLDSYNANLGVIGKNLDLSKSSWTETVKSFLQGRTVDIMVGGPPCQGFSLTGTRVFDDPRNRLYSSFFDGIDKFDPEIIVIENVKGMATLYQGRAKKFIEKELEDRGYSVTSGILNAAYYGVPQFRERLFILARKGNKKLHFSNPLLSEERLITTEDAISDLIRSENDIGSELIKYDNDPKNYYQVIMRENSKGIANHFVTKHKDFVVETIKQVPDGGNHRDLPAGVGLTRKFNEAWTRYSSSKPSRTIDTGHRNHFHYSLNRVPTVRENARLQSFPDNFHFKGSKTSQSKQVGNAVPVFLAQFLASSIYKQL